MNSIDLNRYDYVFFDLDDTLYPEIEYLSYAYKQISKYVNKKYNIDTQISYNFLIQSFYLKGRTNLFNRYISEFNIEQKDLMQFLKILRTLTMKNKISLFFQMEEILNTLTDKRKFIILMVILISKEIN